MASTPPDFNIRQGRYHLYRTETGVWAELTQGPNVRTCKIDDLSGFEKTSVLIALAARVDRLERELNEARVDAWTADQLDRGWIDPSKEREAAGLFGAGGFFDFRPRETITVVTGAVQVELGKLERDIEQYDAAIRQGAKATKSRNKVIAEGRQRAMSRAKLVADLVLIDATVYRLFQIKPSR